MFSNEFFKIYKNTFFHRTSLLAFFNFQVENVKVRIRAEDFEARFNKLEQYGYSTDATMLKYLELLTQ